MVYVICLILGGLIGTAVTACCAVSRCTECERERPRPALRPCGVVTTACSHRQPGRTHHGDG